MAPILEMIGITKRFPGVLANDGVDFELEEGEIHALLGENGAGKTTLMNILYGLIRPDSGIMRLRGKEVQITCPLDALHLGIGMVHQHFMLVPTMTVAENIVLGREPNWGPFYKQRDAVEQIEKVSKEYAIAVSPHTPVWQLSVGEQQRVEILKALCRGADILVLDEPTAVLTPPEVDSLFNSLRSILKRGKSVVFISHKLREVMAISNRVTVLRRAKKIGTVKTSEMDENELARMMVGRDVVLPISRRKQQDTHQDTVATIDAVSLVGAHGVPVLKDISLTMAPGEIVGVAGVDGNGQSELAEVIAGIRTPDKGRVMIKGEELTRYGPDRRADRGVWYIPADRKGRGSVKNLSIAENAILKHHRWAPFSRWGILDRQVTKRFTAQLIRELDVRCSSVNVAAETLSGGNLQKLILARETVNRPDLLIAEHPTRGLDVGAIECVRELLLRQREDGTAVLLISADLEEVVALSDRILVMYEGEIVHQCDRGQIDLEKIGLAMAGLLAARADGAREREGLV